MTPQPKTYLISLGFLNTLKGIYPTECMAYLHSP